MMRKRPQTGKDSPIVPSNSTIYKRHTVRHTFTKDGEEERSQEGSNQKPVLIPLVFFHERSGHVTQQSEGIFNNVNNLLKNRTLLELVPSIQPQFSNGTTINRLSGSFSFSLFNDFLQVRLRTLLLDQFLPMSSITLEYSDEEIGILRMTSLSLHNRTDLHTRTFLTIHRRRTRREEFGMSSVAGVFNLRKKRFLRLTEK